MRDGGNWSYIPVLAGPSGGVRQAQQVDPRDDPIVRVQARRLRVQLARYYREEGQDEEWLIEMPKGGYAPTFHPDKARGGERRCDMREAASHLNAAMIICGSVRLAGAIVRITTNLID